MDHNGARVLRFRPQSSVLEYEMGDLKRYLDATLSVCVPHNYAFFSISILHHYLLSLLFCTGTGRTNLWQISILLDKLWVTTAVKHKQLVLFARPITMANSPLL